ncbi:hypothetical protein [Acinetobacter sp.]|uniref:hypothetical protein n=1 Tax=Acinetobacter sp. TaxID=472 RepID=UPI003890E438
MKPDMKTLNTFRALFHERNKLWCSNERTRLKMFVEAHFIERLFERFRISSEAAQVVKDVMKWIRENYAILQFEDGFGTKRQYRINLSNEAAAVLILFLGPSV